MVKSHTTVALCLMFFAACPLAASAATLSIAPATGSYEVGDTISAHVIVSSDTSINAISGKLFVPPGMFAIQSIYKTGSVLNFWAADPSFDRASGIVSFEGVALNGFRGAGGTVVSLQMKALKAGSDRISFQAGHVLANDGAGTDVTGALSGAVFSITEPTPKPVPAEPAQEQQQEETAAPEPPRTLRAPEILSGTKYGTPSIVGSSDYPKSQVVLTFVAKDGSKFSITGTSDEDGSFNVTIPDFVKRGEYGVSATMIRDDKTASDRSNLIIVTAGRLFSDLTIETILLIGILMVFVVYLLVRIHHLHQHATERAHRRTKVNDRTLIT